MRSIAMLQHPTLLTLALCTIGLTACGDRDVAADTASDTDAAAAAPHIVDVSAGDYSYTMADTMAAGATTFRLTTNGQELHHLQLFRIPDDKSIDDLMGAMMASEGQAPEWAHAVGGPNAPTPMAGASTVTLELQAGKHVAVCFIPSPDGMLHVAKGMSKTFVVVPSETPTALPAATITMNLTDYDFQLSDSLTAGSHVLQVLNAAEQEHEVFIARLAPGATPEQLLAWLEKPEGPPPGEAVGGTVGMAKGVSNFVHLDVTPGEYALICFVPDAGDGKPHFLHGMIKQISVL